MKDMLRQVARLAKGQVIELSEKEAWLDYPQGWRFLVQIRQERLVIRGNHPRDGWHLCLRIGEEMPYITLGLETTPKRLVREIERRLLPKYLPFFERLNRELADSDQVNRDGWEDIDLLAEVTEGRLKNSPSGNQAPANVVVKFGRTGDFTRPYGTAGRFSQKRLTLTLLEVSAAEAEALLEKLREMRGDHGEAKR